MSRKIYEGGDWRDELHYDSWKRSNRMTPRLWLLVVDVLMLIVVFLVIAIGLNSFIQFYG